MFLVNHRPLMHSVYQKGLLWTMYLYGQFATLFCAYRPNRSFQFQANGRIGIPYSLIPKSSAVSLRTYECGPDMLLLLLLLPLSICIAAAGSFRLPLASPCRIPSAGTLAQTLRDICNSISYVINCLRHSFPYECLPVLFYCAVGRPLNNSNRAFY